MERLVVVPSPSWPCPLSPQQRTVPLLKSAHVCPLPAATWAALEESLRLTPSSYGLQPWKFLVVADPAVAGGLGTTCTTRARSLRVPDTTPPGMKKATSTSIRP